MKRLISVVLALTMICPVLAYFAAFGASAALEVDDGTSIASASNIINEEWNFEDMTAGEAVTKGYVRSHANGNFSGFIASETVAGACVTEGWTAIEEDDGNIAIEATNRNFPIRDEDLVLLKNTYEVSFRIKLPKLNSGASTFFYWSDYEKCDTRHGIFRISTNGELGYREGDNNSAEIWKDISNNSVKLTYGDSAKWHSIKIRVNPVNGHVQMWVDEVLRFDFVNTNLKSKAAVAEYSSIGIYYTFTSTAKTLLDDIKLTNVSVDEYVEFNGKATSSVKATWDMEDGTFANKNGITAKKYEMLTITEAGDDTVNTTKRLSVADSANDKNANIEFTLPGIINDYDSIKVSWKMRIDNINGYINVCRVARFGGTNNMIRIPSISAGGSNTGHFWTDNGNNLGTIKSGEWIDYEIVFYPYAGKATIKLGDADAVEFGGNTVTPMIKAMLENNMAFKFQLLYWVAEVNGAASIDDITIDAAAHKYTAEESVDSSWKDSSFDMRTPTVGGMANDDWTIADDPKVVAPSGFWDFEASKVSSVDGITASVGSNMAFATTTGANGANTVAVGFKDPTTKLTKEGPQYTLEGTIKDYETINVTFKVKFGKTTRTSNIVNAFAMFQGNAWRTLFRVGKFQDVSTGATNDSVSVSARKGVDDKGGTISAGTFKVDTWHTVSVTVTPAAATNNISFTIDGGAVKTLTNTVVADLYSTDSVFKFELLRHTNNMFGEAYVDDVTVETTYSDYFYDKLGYSSNEVLKTLTDANGNTRGILAIEDKELYLTNQPFELSFDYMINQKPTQLLNLVKLDMNGTAFTVFRLNTDGGIWNYTSSGYIKYHDGKDATSGKNLGPNVAAKTLALKEWHNVRMVFDPNSGHIMGYIDNVLICDYNINDCYIDESGKPLGVTKNAKRMYIEISSQWSASAIPINDSCIDNLRIRTLNHNEYTKTVLAGSDFDSASTGALTAAKFDNYTELYTKSIDGKFEIASNELNKYLSATVTAGNGIAVDMTAGQAPLASDVVAFEGNFTFGAFGSDGKLDIYSLKRGDKEAVSLLSVGTDGTLYLGELATSKALTIGKISQVKLVFSGISGTGELYVDDEFIAAAPILAQADLPDLSYTDAFGNTVSYGNKRFLVSQSDTEKTLSKVALQRAEMPNPKKASFPEDTLTLLSASGEGTWQVMLDDLSVYKDELGYLYADQNGTAFNDANGRLWGNDFVAEFTYGADAAELTSLADWTLGTTALPLVKAGGATLYAADGATELAVLDSEKPSDIAVAVSATPWEDHISANDYVINATVYVNGEMVGSYKLTNSTDTASGALTFSNASDPKVYFGTMVRNNRVVADENEVKFDGYTAFAVDFEDESFFTKAEANAIDYVEWGYPFRGKTAVDSEGATVTLAEHLTEGENSFFRIRRPELSNKPVAYMEYNLDAMGEYAGLYSIEMDVRYTDNVASSVHLATVYQKNMEGKLTLLSAAYDGRFYFENNGIRYYLCNAAGKSLTVNPVSAEEFTKIGLVINEKEGSYSIWINGMNAYYYGDGQTSGAPVAATAVPLNYASQESYTFAPAKIRLFEGSNNSTSDSIADIDNISIDVIKNGIAPVNFASQAIKDGSAVRFIATVDTLFYNYVGFEVTINSELEGVKEHSDKSAIVFSSVIAAGETVTAESMNGRYISSFTVTDLKTDVYTFTVTPYVETLGEKVYGQAAQYIFDGTHLSAVE